MARSVASPETVKSWLVYAALLGLYLSARGYHSRDGDQAYRLPLLLHRQDHTLYAADPFVRAFDAFNPHRSYLALLDLASRPLGLSAALFGLFVLTFAAMAAGMDRLARAAWPGSGRGVGWVAVGLVLLDRAGNIGTNHLFDGMLLDRLIGLGLGWIALAAAVERPGVRPWVGAGAIGLAALVHPSVGLQLAILAGAGWVAWWAWSERTGVGRREAWRGIGLLGLALVPAALVHGGGSAGMFRGLSREEYRLLAVYVQGPQHMVPHLWRKPQWLAWMGMMVLAGLALIPGAGALDERGSWPAARLRLALLLTVTLLGLGLAWVAIEPLEDLQVTLFQPFRMATVARGLALAILAGQAWERWRRGGVEGKVRATLLAVGLTGDWTLVVIAAAELATTAVEWWWPRVARQVGLIVLAAGLAFLARHDTESGHVSILLALGGLIGWIIATRGQSYVWTSRRLALGFAMAWAVPLAALAAPMVLAAEPGWRCRVVEALAGRCRFGEVPVDDLERLASWCRDHTPASSRFVGPPGPKTFRLWSRREVVFNRAASPYHAAGLADWATRFREHVHFDGSTAAFARAYLADRQGLEGRYRALSDADRAALALHQGATHVLAEVPPGGSQFEPGSPLELLRVEGRFAVYRVRATSVALTDIQETRRSGTSSGR